MKVKDFRKNRQKILKTENEKALKATSQETIAEETKDTKSATKQKKTTTSKKATSKKTKKVSKK